MYSCYMGNGKNTKASDCHIISDSYTTNPVTITLPVYNKMPKLSRPFPGFLVNNQFPHHLWIIIIIVTYFTRMSNTRLNWYRVKTKNINQFSVAEIVANFGLDTSYFWSPLSSVAIAESLCCSAGSPGRILVTVWRSDSICSSVSLSSLSSTICR